MAELLKAFEPDLKAVTLIPSDEGRFEVTVDGTLVYSKLQTGPACRAGGSGEAGACPHGPEGLSHALT